MKTKKEIKEVLDLFQRLKDSELFRDNPATSAATSVLNWVLGGDENDFDNVIDILKEYKGDA